MCLCTSARANPLDELGFGAAAEALAGAVTADATGAAAAHYDPAGIALAPSTEVTLGYGRGFARLVLDGKDAHTLDPSGTSLGLAVPLALPSGWRAGFGLALYVPDPFLLRIATGPALAPRFALLDDGLSHIVVDMGLSLAPRPWLAVGAGATLFADAAGNGIDFDVATAGGEKVTRGALDVTLPIRAAPTAGVRIAPWPWLRLGAAWRGAVDLGVRIDVLARVDIANVVAGDVLVSLRAAALYSPSRLGLGGAVDLAPGLTLSVDVDRMGWSGFRGAAADLRLAVALGVAPGLAPLVVPVERLDDVWTPRVGLAYRRAVGKATALTARAGYAYAPTPVPAQTGVASLADNDRHVMALGGGVESRVLPSVLPGPVSLDVAASWDELVDRATAKDPARLPGAGFSSGGRIVHVTATLGARF